MMCWMAALATTVVGRLSPVDFGFGAKVGFELIGNAGGAFALVGNQLVVANSSLLNLEAGKSKSISVLATDALGHLVSASIDVGINDSVDKLVRGGNGNDTLSGRVATTSSMAVAVRTT
jgi:hypothetical protein